MGCWHKTCGLTNLHITHGTEAYVFVLEPGNEDSHCYATHLYKPLLLPFVTEYNDYGGGENSSGVGFPLVMNGIRENLHEIELGENEYHDIAVKKDKFDEALFFEAVHEGRLYMHDRYATSNDLSEHTKLEYVMFRKDVVDHILENRVIERYVGGGNGTFAKYGDSKDYIQYKFADIVADILPMLQEILEMKTKSEDDPDRIMFKLMGGFEYLFDYKHPNLAAQWLRGDGYRYSRIVDIKDIVATVLVGDSEEAVLRLEAVLTEYLKGVFIDGFMEVTRKSWIPAGHEGSQCQEHDEYRLLIAATTMVLDAEQKQWADENGEDESDV
jgi:hypothetical protein